ncbi:unnamed protein product [Allacma fusca]|uniref:Uncharacterized protein n=1 Tax=Allacma fusca TaxID=39272 RepID=A0A8J2Q6L0_9HEXA|nr:unnamed protein product [Allacma fusca]
MVRTKRGAPLAGPVSCLFNFPTKGDRTRKGKSEGTVTAVRAPSPSRRTNSGSGFESSSGEDSESLPKKKKKNVSVTESEDEDNELDVNFKEYKNLVWSEYRRGVSRASVSRPSHAPLVHGYLRFEPLASLGPKHNRMKLVSANVVEGEVAVRLGKTAESIRIMSPESRMYKARDLDLFVVPYGTYYSLKAGPEGALLCYSNVQQ